MSKYSEASNLFYRGFYARLAFKALEDCPYPAGSYAAEEWQAGWLSADRRAIMREGARRGVGRGRAA